MRIIKDIDENEMILAFLKAEIDSPRFGTLYTQVLDRLSLSRSIIDDPNLKNTQENLLREEILSFIRGYKKQAHLFEGFPEDIIWKRVALKKEELKKIKYVKDPSWTLFSPETRFASDAADSFGAVKVNNRSFVQIKAISDKVKLGTKHPELILVYHEDSGYFVLVEGHARATDYLMELNSIPEELEVIVGFSEDLHSWFLF